MIRRRVRVHGRVQGVFFRETTRRAAEANGVTGSVRNEPDGTVEAVLEGPEDGVSRVLDLMCEGPRGASVERVDVTEEKPQGEQGFRVD